MYKPKWIESFRRLNPDTRKMDARKERLAVDVMIDVKEGEMKVSPKARKYEEDRKKDWHAFRKEKKREDNQKELKIQKAQKFAERYLAERAKRNAEKIERDKKNKTK